MGRDRQGRRRLTEIAVLGRDRDGWVTSRTAWHVGLGFGCGLDDLAELIAARESR